jgi:hypothetical protein
MINSSQEKERVSHYRINFYPNAQNPFRSHLLPLAQDGEPIFAHVRQDSTDLKGGERDG